MVDKDDQRFRAASQLFRSMVWQHGDGEELGDGREGQVSGGVQGVAEPTSLGLGT